MIDLLALLKRLEYVKRAEFWEQLGYYPCPDCGCNEPNHETGCQLAEAIRMLEGEWVRSGGSLICDVEEAKAAVSKIESILKESHAETPAFGPIWTMYGKNPIVMENLPPLSNEPPDLPPIP